MGNFSLCNQKTEPQPAKIYETKLKPAYSSILSDYEILGKIGQGKYGCVYKGHLKKNPDKIVAIKEINRNHIRSLRDKKMFRNELENMRLINHINIIHLEHYFHTQEAHYVVMKYCTQGNLAEYMVNNKLSHLDEDDAIFFLKQIMIGFQVLRSQGLMHRDFTPENVLISDNNLLVIGDLGCSKRVLDKGQHSGVGTTKTMAPEMLQKDEYGPNADLYSIGVVFYFMLYGEYPFSASTKMELLKQIKDGLKFSKKIIVTDLCLDLLKRMLEPNPDRRISWDDFFNHKIFACKKPSGSILAADIEKDFRERQQNTKVFDPVHTNNYQSEIDDYIEEDSENLEIYFQDIDTTSPQIEFVHNSKIINFIDETCNKVTQFQNTFSNCKNLLYVLVILLKRWETLIIFKFIQSYNKKNNVIFEEKKRIFQKLYTDNEKNIKELQELKDLYIISSEASELINAAFNSLHDANCMNADNISKAIMEYTQLFKQEVEERASISNNFITLRLKYSSIILCILYCINYESAFPIKKNGEIFDWQNFCNDLEKSDYDKLQTIINQYSMQLYKIHFQKFKSQLSF